MVQNVLLACHLSPKVDLIGFLHLRYENLSHVWPACLLLLLLLLLAACLLDLLDWVFNIKLIC